MKFAIPAFFTFLLLNLHLLAAAKEQPPPPPPPLPVVDKQLAQAEADFQTAKEMFNPYYAGPLLTPSANNVPPGNFNIQPYIFVKDTYATFTNNRRSRSIPDIWTVNPVMIFQMGLLDWLDFTVTFQGFYNNQKGESSTNFGDTQAVFGIQLMKEELYKPAVRLTIGENFPTGRYEKLNRHKNGIDATGAGCYSTTASLNVSKVVWWVATHPFRYRFSFNYTVPTPMHVQGFNAYGGGFHTRGKVHVGNTIAIDTAIELSFTQKWVLAIDLVYTYQNHTTFSGHKGRTAAGGIASIGAPSNDQLSAAPAIEYNPAPNWGFLLGAWFTITGRNSSDFVAGVLTMTYGW